VGRHRLDGDAGGHPLTRKLVISGVHPARRGRPRAQSTEPWIEHFMAIGTDGLIWVATRISLHSCAAGPAGFDQLVSAETARAAWKHFQDHIGHGLPNSALIYSHVYH
jgi:hypothetical protein